MNKLAVGTIQTADWHVNISTNLEKSEYIPKFLVRPAPSRQDRYYLKVNNAVKFVVG